MQEFLERTDPELRGIRSRSKPRRFCGSPHGHYGSGNHFHKLREDDVKEIRKALRYGWYSPTELAEIHGVTVQTIRHIRDRKTWRHVR